MALDLSAVATKLLDSLGQKGYVILVQVADTYNPVTGVKSKVETEVPLSAVDLPVPDELVDGTYIKSTDKLFILDGVVEPKNNDLIRVGVNNYRIISISAVNHAGTPQVYKVIARG